LHREKSTWIEKSRILSLRSFVAQLRLKTWRGIATCRSFDLSFSIETIRPLPLRRADPRSPILTGRNLPKIWQSKEPEPSILNEKTIAHFTRLVEQTGILQREPAGG
jgi:hypothetical protein